MKIINFYLPKSKNKVRMSHYFDTLKLDSIAKFSLFDRLVNRTKNNLNSSVKQP